ncbi:DUF1642 domain-containing protein [Streptococcus mitis]|nr:DUF1642 domain-containing protein [Streptococcus mitis]
MNKQELIKEFRKIGIYNLSIFSTEIKGIPTESAITLIEQLDEPKPVKVKQCVADWYKKNKGDFETSLFQCIYDLFKNRNDSELNEFENWVIDENTKPFQTLVNMHQFGYEVEEEKRYLVSLKNGQPLVKSQSGNTLYFNQNITAGNYKVTRKELEDADFGWVFDCPGIEIEEVE